MSAHPNVLLIAVLTPEEGSRKTMRAILAEAGDEKAEAHEYIELPGGRVETLPKNGKEAEVSLHHDVMESDYDEDMQISAEEGDLLFYDLVTYGYGEFLKWDDLEAKKKLLEEWCKGVCERHKCSYEIRVSANHW